MGFVSCFGLGSQRSAVLLRCFLILIAVCAGRDSAGGQNYHESLLGYQSWGQWFLLSVCRFLGGVAVLCARSRGDGMADQPADQVQRDSHDSSLDSKPGVSSRLGNSGGGQSASDTWVATQR